jgi:7-cyano-7-deazaguanine reductase
MDPKHLGKASALPSSPEEAVLDYVPNPRPGEPYLVRFVESKSLKLFLGSFRNHCGFHEDVTVGIGQRLLAEMKPKWLRIGGYWYPRGGMPIDVFWQSGPPPDGLWIPDQGVSPYRGRG